MLSLDIRRAELACLVPREEDYAPCLLRIAFEHDELLSCRLSSGVAVRCNCRLQPYPREPPLKSPPGPLGNRTSCPERPFGWLRALVRSCKSRRSYCTRTTILPVRPWRELNH